MKKMMVSIARVGESLFNGEAVMITVPGTEGEMTILPEHTALVSALKKGTITLKTPSDEESYAVESGVIEVSNNQVTVLL